jgi:hypothetical protein
MHWDLSFVDEGAIGLAEKLGAIRLQPNGEVFADPAGHPFCLGLWRAPIPAVSSYSR